MSKPQDIPPQKQKDQPGAEYKMNPQPEYIRKGYEGSEKLKNKILLITGGDSGIGRSVSVHAAIEGAKVAIVYYDEDKDAQETKEIIEKKNGVVKLFRGDLKKKDFCREVVKKTKDEWGQVNILINNAAVQFPQTDFEEINPKQLKETFETNIYPLFFITQAALKHMYAGDSIINTTSITAYRGSHHLIDYASTKGAIVAFTRSLAKNLAPKKIRVNAVAPGPIWTPLIPSTFGKKKVDKFGQDTPLGRPGQPSELGPAYIYLASEDSSYVTGQVIHVNGGEIIGG